MIEAVNDEDGLAAALDALREIHRELAIRIRWPRSAARS